MAANPSGIGDEEMATALGKLLEPGERLLWCGRPRRKFGRPSASVVDLVAIVALSVVIMSVVLFAYWVWYIVSRGSPWALVPWAVFLSMPIAEFLVRGLVFDVWRRMHSVYGVTDARVIIMTRWTIRLLSLHGLTEIKLREDRAGLGTITFGRDVIFVEQGSSESPSKYIGVAPAFESIEDAPMVLRIIEKAQGALSRRSPPLPSDASLAWKAFAERPMAIPGSIGDRKAAVILRELLAPGERLLWCGRPRRLFGCPSESVLELLILLAASAIEGYWLQDLQPRGNSVLVFTAIISGILFAMVAVAVVGRFLFRWLVVDLWRRLSSIYGVTDARLIIVSSGGLQRKARSVPLESLTEISLRPGRSQHGTITFGRDVVHAFYGWDRSRAIKEGLAPAFENIEDAAAILRIIGKAQRMLLGRPPPLPSPASSA
jgi:hypothetical protein